METRRTKKHLNKLGLQVADNVSAMLAYWDKDLVCRFANKAYLAWFGKEREDMIDKMTLPELLGPLYEKNRPFIERALQGEIQTFEREIQVPGGELRSSLANYFPHIVKGEVRGIFVHVADISLVKFLEKGIIESNKIIGDQNKLLLNFAHIVSHNLRSYSSNIQLLLDYFEQSQNPLEKEQILGHLKAIAKSFRATVENANEIVVAQGLSNVKAEPVNLFGYVEKVRNILSVQLEGCRAILNNAVDPSLTLNLNSAYVESIVMNLVSNAIRYRHPDRNPEIDVLSQVCGHEVVLSIKDNGIGIDLSRHGNDLFGMYKTFHGNAEARGIGLFISKFQVESMGGRIEVESLVNVGSTFLVYLPFKE